MVSQIKCHELEEKTHNIIYLKNCHVLDISMLCSGLISLSYRYVYVELNMKICYMCLI